MFEPSWFIAGNVAVSKMNGFEDTVMPATYAEEGDVCELTMVVGVNSISNKNRRPTSTFFLSIILRFTIRLKNVNYPALTDGASPPRDEDFLLLPGNILYTPSEKGMYSRGFLSTGSKGSPDPARRIFREAL